jgi:hypothetical protein
LSINTTISPLFLTVNSSFTIWSRSVIYYRFMKAALLFISMVRLLCSTPIRLFSGEPMSLRLVLNMESVPGVTPV